MLASVLAQQAAFIPGAILCMEEVERRIADQRATVRALGLAVPSTVVIRDRDDESRRRVERRWGLV